MNHDILTDFPLLKRRINHYPLCFLDNALTTQKPYQVIEAISHFYTMYNATPGRSVYPLAEEATQHYENARRKIAAFLQAKEREIIFVRGATEGLNFIAQGWGKRHLKQGDEVVLSELEHHANLIPWQKVVKETGAHLRFIPIDRQGLLDYGSLDSIITSRTKIVAVTQSSNAIGTIVDVNLIIKQAKQVGARVLIDACQSAPYFPINVQDMGCDFLTFSGHKMLGPTGSGVLYIKEDRFDEVDPLLLGGGSVFDVTWNQASLRPAPEKFEAGTPSTVQAIGLAAAIDYLLTRISFSMLQSHTAKLCYQLIQGLQSIPQVTIIGPIQQLQSKGHLVTFNIDKLHPHDVATYLGEKGVCLRAGNFCAQPLMQKLGYNAAIRASFYCYTTEEDVAYTIECLRELTNTI